MKIKKILTVMMLLITSMNYSQELGRMTFMDTTHTETVVRKFKKEYMKFVSPITKQDTIYIGVMADSVSTDLINVSLFGYFPYNLNLNGTLIIIEYQDGSEDVFKLLSVDNTNYAVFGVINDLRNLYTKFPKKIKFRNFTNYNIENKNKNFFIDFFKILD
jgi:hypothetical protein